MTEDDLAKLFIVSDASITDEGSFGTSSPQWTFVDVFELEGLSMCSVTRNFGLIDIQVPMHNSRSACGLPNI